MMSSECACGSQQEYAECCGPFHEGTALPKTAVALMRSRYAAYVKSLIDYLVTTVHPDKRDGHDPDAIRNWSESSQWLGLEIIALKDGTDADTSGTVEFAARFRDKRGIHRHHEIATFKRVEDRWFFFDGVPPKLQTVVRDSPKMGRNDPCVCGSGRKYKKCCGK